MEHLSRRTTRDVDVLLLVTDPTQRGLIAAQRMREMVPELDIGVGHVYLVVNRLREEEAGSKKQEAEGADERRSRGVGGMPAPLAEAVARTGLELVGIVPDDSAMAEFEFIGPCERSRGGWWDRWACRGLSPKPLNEVLAQARF